MEHLTSWLIDILFSGGSPLTSARFMISADGVVVNERVPSFANALAMMFAMHFNLNTKYTPEATAKMDLFQR